MPIIMSPLCFAFSLFLILLMTILYFKYNKAQKNLPPGPRPLPIIGNIHMLRGKFPHRTLTRLAKTYGPIMYLRLGNAPTVVVSSPHAAELFLKQHDAAFASRPVFKAWLFGADGIGITPYGEYWRRVKMMVSNHLLNQTKVAALEGLRAKATEVAMQKLKEDAKACSIVDVTKRVEELIEDITYKMLVGRAKEEVGIMSDYKRLSEEALHLAGKFNLADFVPSLAPLDLQGISRRVKTLRKEVGDLFDCMIEDRLKEKDLGEHRDMLGTLLALMNSNDENVTPSFGRHNVKGVLFDLFLGGIDTVSNLLEWALAELMKNPRVMNVLQGELDAIVGRAKMVEESHLPKLTYLDMVVKETLRLHPPAPLAAPHEAIEDTIVEGYFVPKNSRVIINVWAIARDSKVWSENVDDFYPERFINSKIDVRGNYQLLSFGAGRRICPGINLALVTVKLVLAKMAHYFTWQLPNGIHPEDLDMTEKLGLTMPRETNLLAIPSIRI